MMTVTRTRGDDWTIVANLAVDGTPVDLTGAVVTAQVRISPDAAVTATFVATVSDATNGEIMLTLGRAVTETIAPGVYRYDVEVDGGGERTTYGVASVLRVEADVTRGL